MLFYWFPWLACLVFLSLQRSERLADFVYSSLSHRGGSDKMSLWQKHFSSGRIYHDCTLKKTKLLPDGFCWQYTRGNPAYRNHSAPRGGTVFIQTLPLLNAVVLRRYQTVSVVQISAAAPAVGEPEGLHGSDCLMGWTGVIKEECLTLTGLFWWYAAAQTQQVPTLLVTQQVSK